MRIDKGEAIATSEVLACQDIEERALAYARAPDQVAVREAISTPDRKRPQHSSVVCFGDED